jgi:hypothetical protein
VTPAPNPSGISTYGDLLKDELATQDQRKASFEQRGLAVITTSGTLVTLLFALAALSTKASATFVLPAKAHDWLEIALGLFFGAAVSALVTNVPISYEAPEPDDIKPLLQAETPLSQDEAAKDVALARLAALKDAKTKNSFKGWALVVAMTFEVGALGAVAVAVSYVI